MIGLSKETVSCPRKLQEQEKYLVNDVTNSLTEHKEKCEDCEREEDISDEDWDSDYVTVTEFMVEIPPRKLSILSEDMVNKNQNEEKNFLFNSNETVNNEIGKGEKNLGTTTGHCLGSNLLYKKNYTVAHFCRFHFRYHGIWISADNENYYKRDFYIDSCHIFISCSSLLLLNKNF